MTPKSSTDPAGLVPARRVLRAPSWTPGGDVEQIDREAPTQVLPVLADPRSGDNVSTAPIPVLGRGRRSRPPAREGRSVFANARRTVGIVCLVALLIVGFSMGRALGRPTSDSASAKLAEWGRDHHLGGVVSFLEQKQLELHPAKTGGTVAGGFRANGATPPATPAATASSTARVRTRAHTALPVDLKPFGTAQPGEGQWQVLERVGGLPALEFAGLTPDAVHTSYVASVAWMDPKLLRFELRPGAPSGDPGGTFPGYASTLAGPAQERQLVAAFNSGFRLNSVTDDSQGGFYLNGKTPVPLRAGAASFVVRENGTVTIGQWGRDVSLTSDVLGVRQNLRLLIDHGTVSSTVDQSNSPVWGYTLDGTQANWRSGVGVTKTGAVVYVDGPVMTTRTLAEVLQRAGAVQAMELDINPEWTHLDYFTHGSTGTVAHKLNDAQQASADHYLSTVPYSRDFFAVFARTS